LWNEQAEEWGVPQEDKPSVNKVLASEKGIPLEVEISGELISLTWEGTNPQFCADILEEIIKELKIYLKNDYKSSAQVRIEILQRELDNLLRETKKEDNTHEDLYASIAGLKSNIAELKGENYLVRRFSVVDEPIVPQNPFEPNKKLPVVLSFVLGIFVSVFFVFFWNFVRNARGRLKEKQG
jgi:hypothetical protein